MVAAQIRQQRVVSSSTRDIASIMAAVVSEAAGLLREGRHFKRLLSFTGRRHVGRCVHDALSQVRCSSNSTFWGVASNNSSNYHHHLYNDNPTTVNNVFYDSHQLSPFSFFRTRVVVVGGVFSGIVVVGVVVGSAVVVVVVCQGGRGEGWCARR